MECMIVKVDREGPSVKIIEMAVEKLMQGGVIVYPTDTAYGLGGDATNNRAVDKIYEMKGRNYGKPTHVVVRDWEMISQLCESLQCQRLWRMLSHKSSCVVVSQNYKVR